MKKRMKKMMQHTLLGVAVVAGIGMSGVNPASAATNSDVSKILKDSNGDPIVYGQEYSIEAYRFPGSWVDHKRGFDMDFNPRLTPNAPLILAPDRRGQDPYLNQTFTFENKIVDASDGGVTETLSEDMVAIKVTIAPEYSPNRYLTNYVEGPGLVSTDFVADRYRSEDNSQWILNPHWSNDSVKWMPIAPSADMYPDAIAKNAFALKNSATNALMGYKYRRTGAQLDSKIDRPIDETTMWRFIKK
ncbi:hypothetical protein ACQVTS_31325 [Bacillus mycoides]|uniref:hypothetical protein n=1 Tax=Bacillus mycoides TaxID=1405 RepID=UPI003D6521BA